MLGRALRPLAAHARHDLRAPSRRELDLYDPEAVLRALTGADAVLHLATRIPPREQFDRPGAWRLLDGPGTGHDEPLDVYGVTLHVADAASALLAALNGAERDLQPVCRDRGMGLERAVQADHGLAPAALAGGRRAPASL